MPRQLISVFSVPIGVFPHSSAVCLNSARGNGHRRYAVRAGGAHSRSHGQGQTPCADSRYRLRGWGGEARRGQAAVRCVAISATLSPGVCGYIHSVLETTAYPRLPPPACPSCLSVLYGWDGKPPL